MEEIKSSMLVKSEILTKVLIKISNFFFKIKRMLKTKKRSFQCKALQSRAEGVQSLFEEEKKFKTKKRILTPAFFSKSPILVQSE